jgi:transcriptional regulator with XRE-family HTH domain
LFIISTHSRLIAVHYLAEVSYSMRAQRTGMGSIGGKVRELRTEQGLSLRTLAARTGFSPSFISQMEAEAVSPSIASLQKVAQELGVSLGQFFSSLESVPREVVRREERSEFESGWSQSTVEVLADPAPGRKLSAVQITVEPGGTSGKRAAFELQEAVVLVLSGELLAYLGGREIELLEGDAAYVSGGAGFSWENAGPEEATLVMVAAPGRGDLVSSLLGGEPEDAKGSEARGDEKGDA